MTYTKDIKRCYAYPLMWVMLLWAVTLPGHELAVYSYLVKGIIADMVPSISLTENEQAGSIVKLQTVQVFADAHASSIVVRSPQQACSSAFQLFMFTPPIVDQPAFRQCFQVVTLLASILPVAILPNAP